jgi:DNA-binding transcriptional LysR family regulator
MNLPKTTLEQWALLGTVIDSGGFAQAAQALNRSQSAVSYGVSRLQESLGVPLLAIDGRKAVLTPHGRTLLARSRSLLRELNSLEQLALSLQHGWEAELMLVVDAAFPRTRLLKIIEELQISCPNTQIQLADAVLSGAEEAIDAGRADLIVTSRIPHGFLGDPLLDVEFIAAAHPNHALFKLERELNADDLKRHVQAVVRDSGTLQPRDEGWLGSQHRFTVSSMEAALATLTAGLAYGWLPEHLIAEALRNGVLKRLPLNAGGVRHVSLYLVLARPAAMGPAVRAARAAFKGRATV